MLVEVSTEILFGKLFVSAYNDQRGEVLRKSIRVARHKDPSINPGHVVNAAS